MFLFSPFILLIAIIIFFQGGKIFFIHDRVGENGKKIKIIKFRTMAINAEEILKEQIKINKNLREEWYKNYRLKNDPRVSSFGRFLRKSKLDELPQLINVLKGDISLCGPRPLTMEEIENNLNKVQQKYYLSIKPGLTGIWQIHRHNYEMEYRKRINLEIWYVRNYSVCTDLIIFVKTILLIVRKVLS